MDNDSNVTGQQPVLANLHNESELIHEAEERHNVHAQPHTDITGDAKLEPVTYANEKNQGPQDIQPGKEEDEDSSDEDDALPDDLFVSFPPLKGVAPEESPLTVRAVLIGIILGSLCNASNVYLGMSRPIDSTGSLC